MDLRNDDERAVRPPPSLRCVHVPLDDVADVEMWDLIRSNDLDGTPLYYPIFLERKAERCVAAIRAIAEAEPGGVLVHCGAGRDRTGLVSMLLILLAGVLPEEIIADYQRSNEYFAAANPTYCTLHVLERHATTEHEAMSAVLDALDVTAFLTVAGLLGSEMDTIRARLL